MEQLNKYRSAIVLGVLFLFLLLFAFFMLGLQPTIKELNDQKVEMARIEEETALLQNKVNEMKGTGVTSEISEADSLAALPQSDAEEQLVLDLRLVGARSQAILKKVDFNLTEANEIAIMTGSSEGVYSFIKEVKMNAEIEGSYEQIYAWINELDQLPRIIKVDSFHFQQPASQPEFMNSTPIIANIVFTAYYENIQGKAAIVQ
ncbi:type 4a pilus biogenesis protein PilO [Paenibacillus dakarensis]|uniref:type 4a pilus biogenesis protein PilO n=1 Tax=Paenibacillus dakarensis TaxID=1527293 RepID=UPI0006D532C7|nr:type 4a pilus biogenesis protein PilO [Paenibacillus dakarensis]